MKQTKIIMGMPITVEVTGVYKQKDIDEVFNYFKYVDNKFSTYKPDSEVSKLNKGLAKKLWSDELKEVIKLCETTKRQTNGYFDIHKDNKIDPSGLVKGWSIKKAAEILDKKGYEDYYIEAGGDIQVCGLNAAKQAWLIGIRNPFNTQEIIKVIRLKNAAIATSGTYIRGEHIYNPKDQYQKTSKVKSITVIGPNIYDSDRFATAAHAMGLKGIQFIEKLKGFEGYMVDDKKIATFTRGFDKYVVKTA